MFHSNKIQNDITRATAAVIVAHPDDEILWAGGTIISRPQWTWLISALCRAGDSERAPRFQRSVERLGAKGLIGNLDDGPNQSPLSDHEVQEAVSSLVPKVHFDVILTHGPRGEYTRHRRHEEVCRAVVGLWKAGKIIADSLWMFSYEDGGGQYLPRAEEDAHQRESLSSEIWLEKYRIITELYGFDPQSWEATTVPGVEAFWCFNSPEMAQAFIDQKGTEQ